MSLEQRIALEQKFLARAKGTAPGIPKRQGDGPCPLSFAQQRLWFLAQLEGGLTAYNMPSAWVIRGSLDVEALRRALEALVHRHEALRTGFTQVRGEPLQVVREVEGFELPIVALNLPAVAEREREIERLRALEAEIPFDLECDLMLRTQLLRLSEEEHVLLLTQHHIASDGWSGGVLRRELGILYEAYSRGGEPDLDALAVQYSDYAVWQRRALTGGRITKLLEYWKGQLDGLTALELPTDRPRPSVPSYRGSNFEFELPGDLVGRLKELGRSGGATLQMLLLAAFKVLLFRYSGQDDIAVGAPIAGRNHTELENQIGFFVNTLVLRTDMSGNPSFRDVLRRVREVSLGAYDHQELPFEKMVEELQPERDPGRNPLAQVLLQVFGFGDGELTLGELEVSKLSSVAGRVRFDLEVHLWQCSESMSGVIIYSVDLFDAPTIEHFAGHFLTLLEGIAEDPDQRIGEVPILTKMERHQLLVDWNNTSFDYPQICVHQMFEAQVEHGDSRIALVFEGAELRYGELNERSNQLAHHLCDLGVGPGVLVAIHVGVSLDMVVAVLGVLKAGGAYVPLSSRYPKERLRLMLEDANPKVLIYEEDLESELPKHQAQVVCLEADWPQISQLARSSPIVSVGLDDLVYVLYTSGSTGLPKGVAYLHSGGVNLIRWQLSRGSPRDRIRALLFSPLSFDASFTDIFVTLCAGGTLVMASDEVRLDSRSLAKLLLEQSVERVNLPFVALQSLASSAAGGRQPLELPALSEIISTAEQLRITPAVREWLECNPGISLENQYGPTECHVVTALTLEGESVSWPSLPPIGKPISNTQIYILNQYLEPVPIGVVGSLYIAGHGLAREYLNRPGLTAERFVENPFLEDPKSRLYSTGDLCRWRADGCVDFVGRKDEQVKLRGFRIELGEIEAVLDASSLVLQSMVLLCKDDQESERLVAYCVPGFDRTPNAGDLRSELKGKLPDYMIPSAFVVVEKFPLTTSGKVDRRALPAPDRSRPDLAANHVAPRNSIEERLVELWAELLGLEKVGVHDNFFDLGGHSLLVAKLVGMVNQSFESDLMIGVVYRSPTVSDMAIMLNREELGENGGGGVRKRCVGHFMTVLQEGNGEGVVVFVGGLLKERLSDLPESITILHLALDGLGQNSFLGLGVYELAMSYAEELKLLNLDGRVVIVGHSYGGLLSYALAHCLRAESVLQFELVLLEPTWCGSSVARLRMLWKRIKFAIGRGPRSLMSSIGYRLRRRMDASCLEAEQLELGRRIAAGEDVDGGEQFRYFSTGIMENARAYFPRCPLPGRVHLAYGNKWGELRFSVLEKEYLEVPPMVIELGDVDHVEMMEVEKSVAKWVGVVRNLVECDDIDC